MPLIPLERRSLPKINGSSTGFIILIVFLVLVIVACCVAVYILLRDYEPSDEERSARRAQRARRTPPSTVPTSSSSAYHYNSSSSASTSPFGAILNRLRRLLPIGSSGGHLHRRGTGHRDWVEAGSADEWEYDSGDDRSGRMKQLSPPMKRPGVVRSDTTDSTSPSLANTYDYPIARSLAIPTDPSISSIHVNQSAVRSRSASRATSPVHTPMQTPAASIMHADDASTFTTHSGQMKHFTGGTKFSEGL